MLPMAAKKRRNPTNPTAMAPSWRKASTARAVTYPHSAMVRAPKATTSQVSDRLPSRICRGSASRPDPAAILEKPLWRRRVLAVSRSLAHISVTVS